MVVVESRTEITQSRLSVFKSIFLLCSLSHISIHIFFCLKFAVCGELNFKLGAVRNAFYV